MDLSQDEVNTIHAVLYYFKVFDNEENGTTKRGQALIEKLERKFAKNQTLGGVKVWE